MIQKLCNMYKAQKIEAYYNSKEVFILTVRHKKYTILDIKERR